MKEKEKEWFYEERGDSFLFPLRPISTEILEAQR